MPPSLPSVIAALFFLGFMIQGLPLSSHKGANGPIRKRTE